MDGYNRSTGSFFVIRGGGSKADFDRGQHHVTMKLHKMKQWLNWLLSMNFRFRFQSRNQLNDTDFLTNYLFCL
jgi:hypothetical protein